MAYCISFETDRNIKEWQQLIKYFSKKADTISIQYYKWEEDIKQTLSIYSMDERKIGNVIIVSKFLTMDMLENILTINQKDNTINYFSVFLLKDNKKFFWSEHYGKEYHIHDATDNDLEFIQKTVSHIDYLNKSNMDEE